MWLIVLVPVLRRDLMMFQQNSYRPDRYFRWSSETGETTGVMNLCFLIGAFICLVRMVPPMLSLPLNFIMMLWWTIKLSRAKYKKPLVFTPRAKRIFWVAYILCIVIAIAVLFMFTEQFTAAFMMGLLYISAPMMMLANTILKPYENSLTRKFINDAKDIVKSIPDLKVVGITGSYGKTSTKHYLHRILSEHYETLMTPGSYNTTLGVVRTIREMMKPYTQVFIAEMGAKQPGDIAEIAEIVNPQIGIITAVGEQHLQSFGSIENVQKTKFELVDALPADGHAILNNDFEFVANRPVTNCPATRYAVEKKGNVSVYAKDVSTDRRGTRFTVIAEGYEPLELETRLVGECNVSNLLGAVTAARILGVPDAKIQRAVRQIEQVEHRLNLKHTPGGITIIDDAFNSNPDGSRMALDVLRSMTPGKRIIITPGMIELGEKQHEYNRAFGKKIGESADVAIIVGKYNRDAILEGIAKTDMPQENIHAVDSFAIAQQALAGIATAGDTVLYENDLPDTFK